jgi:hypothetical protein
MTAATWWALRYFCAAAAIRFSCSSSRSRFPKSSRSPRVRGRWRYLYRAIDRDGALVDIMLSEHPDHAAAKALFRSAKVVTGVTGNNGTKSRAIPLAV